MSKKIAIVSNTLDLKMCFGGTFVCRYLYRSLIKLGVDVDLFDFDDIRSGIIKYSIFDKYDVVLTIDYDFNPYLTKAKTVFYSIDEPECYNHVQDGFDLYLTNSRGMCDKYIEDNRNVKWFPFAYDDSVFKNLNIDKVFDIVYVGSGVESKTYDTILKPAMRFAEKNKLTFKIFGRYWNKLNNIEFRRYLNKQLLPTEVNDTYNLSRIVLNMHRTNQCITDGSFIMRDWEARASGAFVLSDYFVGCEYFDGVVSNSPEETIGYLEYFINNDKEREQAAESGYSKIKDETYDKRAKQLLNIVDEVC